MGKVGFAPPQFKKKKKEERGKEGKNGEKEEIIVSKNITNSPNFVHFLDHTTFHYLMLGSVRDLEDIDGHTGLGPVLRGVEHRGDTLTP